MRMFFDLVHGWVLALPLRSLLYTAGYAATTATVFYFVRKVGKITDADPEEASAIEDSGSPSEVPQDQAMLPAAPCFTAESTLVNAGEKLEMVMESHLHFEMTSLLKDVEILKGKFQDMGSQTCETQKKQDEISKNEAELKYQEAQLEIENLKKYVETLRGTIQDMQILIYKTQLNHNQERERDHKAHDSLQLKHEKTMKKLKHCQELLSECERERLAYRNLTIDVNNTNESLTDILKSCLKQVWEKHQKPLESFDYLQFENSNLMEEVETLKSTIQDMGSLIYETQKKQDKEYERLFQASSTLHLEREQMKKSLNLCEQLLMEYEKEWEAHYNIKFEHIGMNTTQTEELLKVALAEAMGKLRRAIKSMALLECTLIDKSETLQEKVQKMGSLISESQEKHYKEFDQEWQAHNILQAVVEKLKAKFHHSEELRKNCERCQKNKYLIGDNVQYMESLLYENQKQHRMKDDAHVKRNTECDNHTVPFFC
ncbi:cingulin-like protein 1 isoform X1 [Silurus meridionalis]|uniref:cingulin-like protein 1 isoform X1 n=1 Tax=Silurus meridionalis TaxID=175797 RepID=UPI001EE9BD4A|nr:cingulin-like protein 1 isoform X1 [Silurus meridionalis]